MATSATDDTWPPFRQKDDATIAHNDIIDGMVRGDEPLEWDKTI